MFWEMISGEGIVLMTQLLGRVNAVTYKEILKECSVNN